MSARLHLFKAKIHRATVTHADLDYEGSVTISGELLDASGILEHEQVHIWNVTRGTRLVTYALRGDDFSGVDTEAVFGVRQTPFEQAVRESYCDPRYAHIVLER